MNCPDCGAPMRLEDGKASLVCDYCKQVYVPETNEDGVRVFDEQSALMCPVCGIPLVHAAMAGYRILYCAHCHGNLVAMPEFAALVGDLRAQWRGAPGNPRVPDPDELRRHISCPQCHRPMDTHFYGGPGNVVIDDCSPCDLDWLDAGELMSIARAPDHTYSPESETISDYSSNY